MEMIEYIQNNASSVDITILIDCFIEWPLISFLKVFVLVLIIATIAVGS